jgi:cardiolipin synthase
LYAINKDKDYSVYFLKDYQKYDNSGYSLMFGDGPKPIDNEYIGENVYLNIINQARKNVYIMTPYFIPDETITSLIASKARSGVDVRIVLPEIADKRFVYVVSRNNVEKLLPAGVKIYTMKSSFVHSKVVLTENSAIVGSINVDLRSFNQQFESAVFTNQQSTLDEITRDFETTIDRSVVINDNNKKRNNLKFRIYAGLFNIISPFM